MEYSLIYGMPLFVNQHQKGMICHRRGYCVEDIKEHTEVSGVQWL